MGSKPNPILCGQLNPSKWYIAEVEVHDGGDPLTGCQRPYVGNVHDVIYGSTLNDWICYHRDCVDDKILLWGVGTAQRLVKIFGPWDTSGDAHAEMW